MAELPRCNTLKKATAKAAKLLKAVKLKWRYLQQSTVDEFVLRARFSLTTILTYNMKPTIFSLFKLFAV